jgi:soluble lytic murein transglycosylase
MSIPETFHFNGNRLILGLALLAWLPFSVWSQTGGAFGLSAARLAEIFGSGDVAPILALDTAKLDDSGSFGPASQYYLALWLDDRISEDPNADLAPAAITRIAALYRIAYDRGEGFLRKEAALKLIDFLAATKQWESLESFAAEYGRGNKREWRSERPRLEALDAQGKADQEGELVRALITDYPAEAAKDAAALDYFAAAAGLKSGLNSKNAAWAKAFRIIILGKPWGEWSSRSYALLGSESALAGRFTEAEAHAAAMRDAVWRRDYGAAYAAAKLALPTVLSRSASRYMVADCGKAFLYAGMAKEGIPLFAEFGEKSKGAVAWTALFYRARFERSLEEWDKAEALFSRAQATAPKTDAQADEDSAAWYAADSSYRGSLAVAAKLDGAQVKASAEKEARQKLLKRLILAASSWQEAEPFADLALGLFRDALRSRDWALVASMAESLGPKLPSDTESRLRYVQTRAYELGLLGSGGEGIDEKARSDRAAERFALLAEDKSASAYYRILAAWRAGVNLSLAAPDLDAAAASAREPAPICEEATLLAGMARFGLVDLALAEARGHKAELDDESLRSLAALFSALGRPDDALRFELELSNRPDFVASRMDFELSYPRPYLLELRDLKIGEKLPEELAYGLVRSESAFRVDAVSAAGAVGLSQLMPGTAMSQAKALGMERYDLKNPKDNLAIGLGYFSSLLDRAGGKPLRAMMAYNAGYGRLKAWITESGDLPDDLLLEAIGIEETRGYCRNIVQSTAMYGELYYGKGKAEIVKYLMEGR